MLRKIFKKIVVKILTWEARLILLKYKPRVIGVTGSVGKTSTKEAIATIMAKNFKVRKSAKSYNSEFGVPLTVIGCKTAWNSLSGWLHNIYRGLLLIVFKYDYPDWLVLEVGADRPRDIKDMVKWVKFDVAVMTRLPDIPAHIEFFKSKEEVIDEKMALPESVRPDGLVILNSDDPNITGLRHRIKAKVMTYGFDQTADVRAENEQIVYEEINGCRLPKGLSFKLQYGGSNVPVRVNGTLGRHLIFSVLAAFAVGVSRDVNLVSMIETMASYVPPPGRLRIIPGVKNSLILDDTYNSSPTALEAGLKTLGELDTAGQKIAVIGDMLELGGFTVDAHRRAGELASEVCTMIVTVGLRAKFADDAAREKKFDQNYLFHFDDSLAAGQYLQNIINAGDVIFVKGSQSMRMERVVEEIMLHPELKINLLVRQDAEWLNKA